MRNGEGERGKKQETVNEHGTRAEKLVGKTALKRSLGEEKLFDNYAKKRHCAKLGNTKYLQ